MIKMIKQNMYYIIMMIKKRIKLLLKTLLKMIKEHKINGKEI